MTETSKEIRLTVTPYLYYEDVERALAWLSNAFGFVDRESETMRNDDGRVVHASMVGGDEIILMGCPGPSYKCPKRSGHVSQNLYVYVDDVEQHFARSKRAGAEIISELEDTFYGDRNYGVEDLEGHRWYFSRQLQQLDSK
ncbi:MAG: VOC family protein [Myxococcales bacterium]|nr:VOC family protein [Myxococcales bacterium]